MNHSVDRRTSHPLTGMFLCMGIIAAAPLAHAQAQEPTKVSAEEADKMALSKADKNGSHGMAHAMHLKGKVTLEYTVTENGTVKDITPIDGDKNNGGIVRQATNIVAQWTYHPYLLNGKPAPMRTTTVISFP